MLHRDIQYHMHDTVIIVKSIQIPPSIANQPLAHSPSLFFSISPAFSAGKFFSNKTLPTSIISRISLLLCAFYVVHYSVSREP